VLTRVLGVNGRHRLEVRMQVELSDEDKVARAQAEAVAGEVDQAVGLALASAAGAWRDIDEVDLLQLPGGGS
jgi:hypothetical protein